MDAKYLGALWDRWRRTNDDEALASLLECVEPELLRTARKYASDEASALDLVQETWRAAITKAWDYDEAQPLVPWLVGFLIIETRRERRRAARVVDRDRLMEREVPEPVEAADLGEMRAKLRTSIDTLPELYRDVVLLSFENGLEPAEIAQRLQRSPGAVRVQLHRALAMLKRTLPKGFALGAAVLAASGSSEAAMRAAMLDEAIQRGPDLVAEGVRLGQVGAGTAGSFAAWKLWLVAITTAVLVGGAWWALAREVVPVVTPLARVDSDTRDTPRATNANTAAIETTTSERASIAPTTVPTATTSVPAQRGVLLVVDVGGIEPASGESFDVALRPADLNVTPRRMRIAAAKHFELDLSDWYTTDAPRPREFFAVLDAPRFVVARNEVFLDAREHDLAIAASSRTTRFEIPLTIALAPAESCVTGRVLRATSTPDARLFVGLFEVTPQGLPASEPDEAKPVDEEGRFTLRARAAGPHLLAVVGPDKRPRTEHLALIASEVRNLGDIALDAGEILAGVVRTTDGKPAVRAQLQFAPTSKGMSFALWGQPLTWLDDRFEHSLVSVLTDEHGLFLATGFAPRAYAVTIGSGVDTSGVRAQLKLDDDGVFQGTPPPRAQPEVVATATGLELVVPENRTILRVTSRGEPVAHCSVSRLFEGGGFAGNETDESGRIVLLYGPPHAVDARSIDVRIDKLGFEPKTLRLETSTLHEGQTIEVELAPGPAPAHLSFEAGDIDITSALFAFTPLAEFTPEDLGHLAQHPLGLMTPGYVATGVDEHGALRQPLRPGKYKLLVRPSDAPNSAQASTRPTPFLPTWFDLDVAAGETSVRHLELSSGGRIRFAPPKYSGQSKALSIEIVDARGETVSTTFTAQVLRTDSRQGRTRSTRLVAGASNESDVLSPGKYTITIRAPDAEPLSIEVQVESGRTTEVAVDLKPR